MLQIVWTSSTPLLRELLTIINTNCLFLYPPLLTLTFGKIPANIDRRSGKFCQRRFYSPQLFLGRISNTYLQLHQNRRNNIQFLSTFVLAMILGTLGSPRHSHHLWLISSVHLDFLINFAFTCQILGSPRLVRSLVHLDIHITYGSFPRFT